MPTKRSTYDVTIRVQDLKRNTEETTRAFPSGGRGNYATPVNLVCGALHWVHVSIERDRRMHVVAGNKRAGDPHVLSPAHDAWADLEDGAAKMTYDLQERFRITVEVGERAARPAPAPAMRPAADSTAKLDALLESASREDPIAEESTLQSWLRKVGLAPEKKRRRSAVVRRLNAAKAARMRT